MRQPTGEISGILSEQLPSESEIRSQLARILSSEAFDASVRNRNFLRFVVEETVAGRTAYIKGYTVAQSVFGRGTDFDPQLDPVVRIEASRLRRSLERYYLTVGKTDPIRIELPKGGYVPRFEKIPDDEPRSGTAASSAAVDLAPPPRRARDTGPSIIVLPFENLGGELSGDLLARGITEELVGRLLAYKELRVICTNTSFRLGATADPEAACRQLALGYVLKGAVRAAAGRLRISMQLLDVADGQYLWAESFDRELTANDIWGVQEEIAAEIATRLGAPYGAIANLSRNRLARRDQHRLDDYVAVLKAYGYFRQTTPAAHAEIRDCLERAVELNPAGYEAWAQLARVYIDEYRFGFNPRPKPLHRALAAAEQAVTWGGGSALSHLAVSLVHHYRREHEKAYETARHAVALNPDNPEVLAQAAVRLMLSGAWEEGTALLTRAMSRDPEPPAWNYVVLTLEAMRREDYGAALRYGEAARESRLPHVLILLSVAYQAIGAENEAAAAFDAACSEGREWSDLWEQISRSVHDTTLLHRIERNIEQVRSRQASGRLSGQ